MGAHCCISIADDTILLRAHFRRDAFVASEGKGFLAHRQFHVLGKSHALFVDGFLEPLNRDKDIVECRWGIVEHHRQHRAIVGPDVLYPRFSRKVPGRAVP